MKPLPAFTAAVFVSRAANRMAVWEGEPPGEPIARPETSRLGSRAPASARESLALPTAARILTVIVLGALILAGCAQIDEKFVLNADLTFALPVGAVPSVPDEVPALEEAPAAGKAGAFTVSPARLTFSRTVDFVDGLPEEVSYHVDLQLVVGYPQDVIPMLYTEVVVEEVITDTMENLSPVPYLFGRENRIRGYLPPGWEQERHFNVFIHLEPPQAPVRALKRVKGSFVVKYATRVKKVEVKPVGEWVGKRIESPGMDDMEVYLDELEKTTASIRFENDTYRMLKQMRFLDIEGKEIRHLHYSGKGGKEHHCSDYRIALPRDGAIVFYFCEDLREERVPFDLKNLSLGGKERRPGIF